MSAKNKLDKAWNQYEGIVFNVAKDEFERIIKPWLEKNNYRFLAGNGDFCVKSGDKYIKQEDMPKYIRDILYMEIPGMSGNDLGSIMPDLWK